MDTVANSDITGLLARWRAGDALSENAIFQALYPKIKQVAGAILQQKGARDKLGATELVGIAFERLRASSEMQFENRNHFIAIAARVLRLTLVDLARHEQAHKRGESFEHVNWTGSLEISAPSSMLDVIALDQLLTELGREHPDCVALVEAKVFGGLDLEEIAVLLECSRATVTRSWRFARAWLGDRLAA
jgi:RNA polymerase sigma factor (TIGR02999 family)